MGMMNELKVLDPDGHTRTSWDVDEPAQVDEARRLFERLTGRGYRAFRVGERETGVANAFDPKEKETLLVPPIRGG